MQPGVTTGAVVELHAAKARAGIDHGQNAVRTNLCTNPSFETDTDGDGRSDGWNFVSAKAWRTNSRIAGRLGGAAQRVEWAGQAEDAGQYNSPLSFNTAAGSVVSGDVMHAVVWVKGSLSGCTLRLYLDGRTAGGSETGQTNIALPLTSSWVRFDINATMGANASYCNFSCYINGDLGAGDSVDVAWDDVVVEKSGSLGDYFDGASVITDRVHTWTGTAHASTSTQTDAHGQTALTTTWDNTATAGLDATLYNFAGESPWQGAGSALDPYRCLFDGSKDYVYTAAAASLHMHSCTLEVWSYRTAHPAAGYPGLIQVGDGSHAGPEMYLRPTTGYVTFSGLTDDSNRRFANSTSAPPLNAWAHIVGRLNTATGKVTIFANGTQIFAEAAGSTSGTTATATPDSYYGFYGGSSSYFAGSLAVARIYSVALSDAEIATNYAAGPAWIDPVTYAYPPIGSGVVNSSRIVRSAA